MKLWIRLDVAISSDPNVAELASRLNLPFAEAVGLCTLVWCAIAEHRPNGDVTGISISALEKWAHYVPRKAKPAGSFGRAFLELFVTKGSASGWRDRQGKLVEQAEKERARKRRGDSAESTGDSAPTGRDGTEHHGTGVVPEQLEDQSEETSSEPPAELPSNGTPPRVVLPREAESFLAQFYEPVGGEGSKSRDRYVNVKGQLYEVLDPLHPGPKLRGGQRVKARSTEHLIDCMKSVQKDPPPNRDLAILWLLNKLTDPAKGPTVSEKHKATEQAERQLEERYHVEAKRAGVQWAKENPDEYQPILQQVEANYRGNTNAFAALAKQTELTQKCAKAAGFPPFEEWREHITEAVA